MIRLAPPPVVFEGRTWTSGQLGARSEEFRARLDALVPAGTGPIALCMVPHPDTVALWFALAQRPVPLILLPPDPRAWRSAPAMPPETPVVVAGADRPLAGVIPRDAWLIGLSARTDEEASEPVAALQTPGLVFLTSGSTGGAKPVYRTLTTLVRQAETLNRTVPFRDGGVLAVLPLSGAHGFVTNFLQPTLLGRPMGVLAEIDHRSVLEALARAPYDYISATPFLASILTRCTLPPVVPPMPATVRIAGGRVGPAVAAAFAARFGVRPEPQYGTTEHGTIAILTTPGHGETAAVGRPLDDVEVRIGDDPRRPHEPGAPGRVWVRSPWRMEGYGFPPALEPRPDIDDWSPTEDVGVLSASGELSLLERMGDSFKASSGYLVSAERVTQVLLTHPAVSDAVVVPVSSPRGVLISALVETRGDVDTNALREHANRLLPPWMQPSIVRLTSALPRLTGGKPDRSEARRLLESLV